MTEITVSPQKIDVSISESVISTSVVNQVIEVAPQTSEISVSPTEQSISIEVADPNKKGVDGNRFTGWAQYRDTYYTVSNPIIILNNTEITLPNNAGIVISGYLPNGVTSFYDKDNLKVTPKAVGDYNIITVRLKAKSSYSTSHLEFSIDIGGSQGKIFPDLKVFPKGANIEHSFAFISTGFSLTTFVANGGMIKLKANGGDISVYDIEYQVARLHTP